MKKVFALFSIITLTLLFMTSCVSMEKSDNSDNSIVNDNGKVLFELNDNDKKKQKLAMLSLITVR